MSISNVKHYPADLKKQVIGEVKNHNRLLSDVAKQYGISAKMVYQWVRNSHPRQTEDRGAIMSEIAHLQQKITLLNQQLQTMAG